MKELFKITGVFIILLFTAVLSYSNDFYTSGHILLGFNIAGGNSQYTQGEEGFVFNISGELILDTWVPQTTGLAVGFLINGSVFVGSTLVQGGLSLVPTFHVGFFDHIDWYVGLGLGLTLYKNTVQYGAGLSTGFNIVVEEWFFINIGLELQGIQIFGGVGIKFKIEIIS